MVPNQISIELIYFPLFFALLPDSPTIIYTFNIMTTLQEKNKMVVQKYFEDYWGKGNVDVVDEVCADNFVIDYPMHGPRRGKEAAKKMLLEFREV